MGLFTMSDAMKAKALAAIDLQEKVKTGEITSDKASEVLEEVSSFIKGENQETTLSEEAKNIIESSNIKTKKKISTIGWVAIIGGSMIVVGGIIFLLVRSKK